MNRFDRHVDGFTPHNGPAKQQDHNSQQQHRWWYGDYA